jgi:hypothetical protein
MSSPLGNKQRDISSLPPPLNGRVVEQATPSLIPFVASQLLSAQDRKSGIALSALASDQMNREEIKKRSLLNNSPSPKLTRDQFFKQGKILANSLGDTFISNSLFESIDVSTAADHMVHSLGLLTQRSDLFSKAELDLLDSVKSHFTQFSREDAKIRAIGDLAALRRYTTKLASRIAQLAPGDSLSSPFSPLSLLKTVHKCLANRTRSARTRADESRTPTLCRRRQHRLYR